MKFRGIDRQTHEYGPIPTELSNLRYISTTFLPHQFSVWSLCYLTPKIGFRCNMFSLQCYLPIIRLGSVRFGLNPFLGQLTPGSQGTTRVSMHRQTRRLISLLETCREKKNFSSNRLIHYCSLLPVNRIIHY